MGQDIKKGIKEDKLDFALLGYVKNELKKGSSINIIKNKLIQAGHDIDRINRCISKIEMHKDGIFNKRNVLIFVFLIIIFGSIACYFLLGDKYYSKKGFELYEQEKYEEALEELNKAIELNPKNFKAHNRIGLVYYQRGEYDQAIEEFNKAIKLNPDFGAPYSNLILIYHNQGNYDMAMEQAIKLFKKGIELKPNRFMAHNRLGICYYQQKRYDLAIEQFNKSIELNPDNSNFAFKLLGQTYSQLGQNKLAGEQFNKTEIVINETLLETPCYFINKN